jgi:hypothetical protein
MKRNPNKGIPMDTGFVGFMVVAFMGTLGTYMFRYMKNSMMFFPFFSRMSVCNWNSVGLELFC